jgi:hypothetical protein
VIPVESRRVEVEEVSFFGVVYLAQEDCDPV